MAELHLSLKQLLDSFSEKSSAYKSFIEAQNAYDEKMNELSQKEYIDLQEFQEVEDLYNNKELAEKTFNIQQELFSATRQDIVVQLIPIRDKKLRFEYKIKNNEARAYYIWLNFNKDEPDKSGLFLLNLDEPNAGPEIIL